MATSTIRKFFENLKGLNDSFTKLTRPADYAEDAQNIVWLPNGNLDKRKGGKLISQVAGYPKTSSGKFRMPLAIMPYSYTNPDTLGTSQDLVVISINSSNDRDQYVVERLTSGTLAITYTGPAATVNLTFKPNSSNVWELNITENGVAVSGFPKQYGTGLEDSPTGLSTLVSDIDALANYACTATFTTNLPAAILPLTTSLNLSGGSGSISYNYLESLDINNTNYSAFGDIDFRTADYIPPSFVSFRDCLYLAGYGSYLFKFDGSILRRAGRPVPSAPPRLVNTGAVGGVPAGTYTYYYTYVSQPNNDKGGEIESALSEGTSITIGAATSIDVEVPSVFYHRYLGQTVSTGAASTSVQIDRADLTGLVPPITVGIYDVGTSLYNAFTVTSFNGNTNPAVLTVTVAVRTDDKKPVLLYESAKGNFAEVSATTSAIAQTNATVLNCTNSSFDKPLFLKTGDYAVLTNSVTGGTYITRKVTASTTTTITIEGSGIDTRASSYISPGSKIRIYRTKNGGFEKFLLGEITDFAGVAATTPTVTFTDVIQDEALKIQYLPPINTPDPPPMCKLVVAHQNLLVVAGDSTNPNNVSFSEPDNCESFPLASNSFAPSFSDAAGVTGLASDNGVLIVFSEAERAVVSGSLSAGDFRIDVVSDGVGCVAPSSIATTENGIIWLSKRGFERSVAGQIDNTFYLSLWQRFRGQFYRQVDDTAITTAQESQLVMQRARATFDSVNNLYVCFIPCETGTPDIRTSGAAISTTKYANSSSKWFVYDTEQDAWAVFSLPEKMNAAGGLATFQNDLYWASAYKADSSTPPDVAGQVVKRHSTGTIYDYADGADAISASVSTSWESLGEPNLIKKLLTLKIWQMMSDALLPFTVTVDVYYDWSDSNTHTSTTKTFSSATTIEHDVKAKAGKKVRSFKVKFSNNTLHESLSITGMQAEVSLPYRVEVKS